MARVRSPEKRSAILPAGLGAPTAKIARRAGVAEGTLFTYFASKEELLNELYLELKIEVYQKVNVDFPHNAPLKRRTWHVWYSFLDWAIEFPEKRKASVQLNVSDLVTPETRAKTATQRGAIDGTLSELANRAALNGLPAGFAAATMSAMQEATMDFAGKRPKQRQELIKRAFEIFWRAVR
jgi:AcrR family transcriptional regulator